MNFKTKKVFILAALLIIYFPLTVSSIEPKKLAEFVKIIRDLEKTFYLKKDNFSNSEKNYARTTNKNWVAKKNIKKGQKLNLSNLVLKYFNSNKSI